MGDGPNILVTGMGALIGQGIARGLRASGPCRIIGLDRACSAYGSALCDAFELKPSGPESADAYLEFWADLLARHSIDLVLPGISVDMYFLDARRAWLERGGTRLALNAAGLIAATRDKYDFHAACADLDLPRIPTARPESWERATALLGPGPLLLKPRRGEGSQGIELIPGPDEFDFFTARAGDNWMLQKLVGCDDTEYTVGAFGLGGGEMLDEIIVFRRSLTRAGNTGRAEVVAQPLVEEASRRLLRHFRAEGPTNLQFRVGDGVAYLLEINPRFSSSCSLRTAFGFNEAAMSVDHYLHRKRPAAPVILPGRAERYTADHVSHARDTL